VVAGRVPDGVLGKNMLLKAQVIGKLFTTCGTTATMTGNQSIKTGLQLQFLFYLSYRKFTFRFMAQEAEILFLKLHFALFEFSCQLVHFYLP
jgi:hypothetical protein